MQNAERPPPNFLEALFGLMLSPGETVEDLLDRPNPPYGETLFVCVLLTVFVPVFSQIYKYGSGVYEVNALVGLFLCVAVTFFGFFCLEWLLLRLCRVQCATRYIFASSCYCLAPVLLTIWLLYLFNYLATGRLSVLHLVLTGQMLSPDRFLGVIPIAALIAYLMTLVVLFYCLRFVGEMYSETALLMTVLSLVPLAMALVLGIACGELVRPGTQEIFWRLIFNPAAFAALR